MRLSHISKDDEIYRRGVEIDIKTVINSTGLFHIFNPKQYFLTKFYELLHPSNGSQKVDFRITRNHMPYCLIIPDLTLVDDTQVFIRPKAKGAKTLENNIFTINEKPVVFYEQLGELKKEVIKDYPIRK